MAKASARCPICRTALLDDAAKQPRPFCSARCRSADLGNWLNGRYVIAEESEVAGLSADELAGLSADELAVLREWKGADE